MCINKQNSEKKASLHKSTDMPSICLFSILCLKQASLGRILSEEAIILEPQCHSYANQHSFYRFHE